MEDLNTGPEEIFENIFAGVDGYAISQKGREKMRPEEIKNLIYGEISMSSLAELLREPSIKAVTRESNVFCDLGSGIGRIVIGATLLCPHLSRIVGIELLDTLHAASEEAKKKFATFDPKTAERITFINSDFFKEDFSPNGIDADIIFLHFPMIGPGSEDLYVKLEDKMRTELKPGSVVISAIRKLKNLAIFPVIGDPVVMKCSYGTMTIFLHGRI
jgi:hypothetical protein